MSEGERKEAEYESITHELHDGDETCMSNLRTI